MVLSSTNECLWQRLATTHYVLCATDGVYGFPIKGLIEIVNGRHGEAETRRNEVV